MIFVSKRLREQELRLEQLRHVIDDLRHEERQSQVRIGTLEAELRVLQQEVRGLKSELSELRMKVFAMKNREDRQDHDINQVMKQLADRESDGR